MEGADARQQREMALVWWGAMLPHMKKPPTFEKFTGIRPDRQTALQQCIAAWDRVDAALRRGKG